MKKFLSRRQKSTVGYGLIAAGLAGAVTLAFVYLRPEPEPYRAGDRVEGITSALKRDLPPDYPRVEFVDVAEQSGIQMKHFAGERSTQLPEDMGSGAAWGDFDGDGWLDLYVCNFSGPLTWSGQELERSTASGRLFRNNGDGSFTDVSEESGLALRERSMAAAWADYDGDGDVDLVVTGFGRNRLFQNQGDGTFVDVSASSGIAGPTGFWTGASWADYDLDGDLDLYICGYVRYEYHAEEAGKGTFQYKAVVPFTLNPSSYQPERNLLYRNRGDGTFEEVAARAGVQGEKGRSLSAAWADFDEDGRPDLYVANDISDNALYKNLGNGSFEDISHQAWVADYRGAMGLAIGDWNNDGDQDIFVSHWIAQENALFDNLLYFFDKQAPKEESMHFFDIADQTGLGQVALPFIGWGTSFLDYDNDSRLDLLVVNGSTFQEDSNPLRLVPMRNFLFWNRGTEEGFYEVGPASGKVFQEPRVGRGAAFADYDNDGDIDVLVVNHGERPWLLRNEGGNRNNWLTVRVRDEGRNAQGIGAKVEVKTVAGKQIRVIGAQSSYLSQNAAEAYFGLGSEASVQVIVRFPDGTVRTISSVSVNQILEVSLETP